MATIGLTHQSGQRQPAVMPHLNDVTRYSRLHFTLKFAQTVFIAPITSTALLACRLVKLITWDVSKALALKVLGYHIEAGTFLLDEYLKTVRVARDILFIPTVAHSAFKDMVRKEERFVDDFKVDRSQSYLKTGHTKKFEQFSSYMYGHKTFEVIKLPDIQEIPAESDGALNTVMASHFLKPGLMAINFGIPNVAAFATEGTEKAVQTVKVDAKSLWRDKMAFHPTNGKIQSGIFFVPTNLPSEAVEKFKAAALKLAGRKDFTCVNTNCHVLQEAGFSIEGKKMEDVIFPTTLMEHLLFRNVFYTDSKGVKHKVHFNIINTTSQSLEEHFEKIDMAVAGTWFRHRSRNADTDENRKARGEVAKALLKIQEDRLQRLSKEPESKEGDNVQDQTFRKITISVPSFIGNTLARIWGRHTVYEVHLADRREEIAALFNRKKLPKLNPFPHAKPSLGTRLKRDFFFSRPIINFLRRHMMGSMDTLYLNTEDLFSHLKATEGERLNYVLLEDKVVVARVNVNKKSNEVPGKVADWALSKHALLAGREAVYCSGELWYAKDRGYVMNRDSGTYMPDDEHVKTTVELANHIFKTNIFVADKAA